MDQKAFYSDIKKVEPDKQKDDEEYKRRLKQLKEKYGEV
jgi:hypothetical protein